jgi:hypothetical protein
MGKFGGEINAEKIAYIFGMVLSFGLRYDCFDVRRGK